MGMTNITMTLTVGFFLLIGGDLLRYGFGDLDLERPRGGRGSLSLGSRGTAPVEVGGALYASE